MKVLYKDEGNEKVQHKEQTVKQLAELFHVAHDITDDANLNRERSSKVAQGQGVFCYCKDLSKEKKQTGDKESKMYICT